MDLYDFLKQHSVDFERFDHPAVFTCEESQLLCPDMPGVGTKNLLLRDKNGKRHFLVVVDHETIADLKKLRQALGVSKLSFASPQELKNLLGVEPGSVTLLGLMHDHAHAVEVIFDEKLWGQTLQCHPLVNTASLAISSDGIQRFLKATGHGYRVIPVPRTV